MGIGIIKIIGIWISLGIKKKELEFKKMELNLGLFTSSTWGLGSSLIWFPEPHYAVGLRVGSGRLQWWMPVISYYF